MVGFYVDSIMLVFGETLTDALLVCLKPAFLLWTLTGVADKGEDPIHG